MYTDDAYLMPPQADLVRGRDGIQQFWKGASGQVGDMKLTTVDVKPFGTDAAREIGTFSLKTKGQQQQEVVGKYVVLWQKVGSDWKLATDLALIHKKGGAAAPPKVYWSGERTLGSPSRESMPMTPQN